MAVHCKACQNEDNEDMVQCDVCDDWYHYVCVGVDNDIEHEEWHCVNCRNNSEYTEPTPKGNQLSASESKQAFEVTKASEKSKVMPEPPQAGSPEQQKNPDGDTRIDRKISSAKRRSLLLQRLEEEKQMKEKRDNEFLQKKYAMLDDLLSSSESEADSTQSHHTKSNTNPDVSQSLLGIKKFGTNKRVFTHTPKVSQHHSSLLNAPIYNAPSGETSTSILINKGTVVDAPLPTKQQMAARQIMSKEHVTFSGRIEEWPRFITWFDSTTASCGYTNCENLRRLQTLLKGDAFKTVGMRLFFPEQVPGAMKSLHQLYGRPEDIIDDLIDKIRKEPPPRIDRLQSIIQFSLTVQNVCAIMQATGMHDHLANPSLVRELVEKLPPQIRLDWGSFRKSVNSANLGTFNDWLSEIATSASQVTRMNSPHLPTARTEKYSTKSSVYFHSDSELQSSNKTCPICDANCNSSDLCNRFLNFNLNERWNAVKRFNICRTCLHQHGRTRCQIEKTCGVDGCTYKHHKLLHKTRGAPPVFSYGQNEAVNCHNIEKSCVLFRIIPVSVHNGETKIDTFAFLDDGSSISLIDESLASKLGVSGKSKPLCLKWTANTHRTESTSKIVNINISPINSTKQFEITNIRTVNSLGLPTQDVNIEELARRYPHLRGLPITPYSNAKPEILLGLDQWKLNIPLRSREGLHDEPAVSKTRLGWTVYGTHKCLLKQNKGSQKKYNFHICDCHHNEDNNLTTLFKEFISIDSSGIRNNATAVLRSSDDEKAIEIMKHKTIKEKHNFVVPLLWKHEQNNMPDSRPMAVRRLMLLEKRLEKDEHLKEKMNTQIEEYQKKEYARKLTQTEIQRQYPHVWYLPIFPVVNQNKPNKIRIVWDAAAMVNNVSLNSMLLSGPDIVPSLVSVLFRFRERRVAICADIKEMFHQVKIRESDQHAQRFLWRNKQSNQIEEFKMQVMTFGSTCSPFCAQYVKNENAKLYERKFPRASKAIIENHYVDDYLDSVDTDEEAIRLANEVVLIHGKGGFHIRNFLSNSKAVMNSFKEKAASQEKSIRSWSISVGPEKILGMWWATMPDLFSFTINTKTLEPEFLCGEAWPTKRKLLKTLMTVFDPLGLIANFLVLLKILLQEVWSSRIGWDDNILPKHLEKWRRWLRFIPEIRDLVIERPYAKQLSLNSMSSVQLHIFVDASELAYAAVGYFRYSDENIVKIVLVAAKTKVAPLKVLSIPRLELEAALLGVKLARMITAGHSIKISERYFWSDSRTVLSWINSDHRKYKKFVAFRVGEILEETNIDSWRWLPSKINVADEGTKWQNSKEFRSDSRWYRGPSFLKESIDQWPKKFNESVSTDEEICYVHIHNAKKFEPIIEIARFSKWQRLYGALAQVFRYIRRAYKKDKEYLVKHTTSIDFAKAENYCFKMCQIDAYAEEIAALRTSKQSDNQQAPEVDRSSTLYKLSPYLDEDSILRVKGRIDAAYGVSIDTKRPIILSNGHYITELVIMYYHERFNHQNDETVVNELRQRFFVPRLRVLLQNIKRKCQVCKNNKTSPKPPIMGDLPSARLKPFTRPFSYIGIDYFGPLYVKVGRHSEKRWGVLITCMTVRAIHIEIAYSLSTDSCLMALNRFIARRGWPLEVFSDNGTNFRGVSTELKDAVQQIDVERLAENFVGPNLKWNFIPPAAPHMGGSWERLVRSVKKTLNCITPTRKPTDELLLTMLTEVERTINTRPLTYVPLGIENEEALTPNHFLLGSSNGKKMSGELSDDDVVLRKNWLISEQFANRFWKRWVSEYLPELTRRTKWYSHTKQPQEGDIIIIADPSNPRNTWPKGIVLKTFAGRDGVVRSATVKTATGVYTRPTAKLALLDVGQLDGSGKPVLGTVLPGGSVDRAGSTKVAHSHRLAAATHKKPESQPFLSNQPEEKD